MEPFAEGTDDTDGTDGTDGTETSERAVVEHKHLRSALEFAVLMASEGQKRKPAIPFPKELKPFFNKPRLPGTALGRLRRIIEQDVTFRARLSTGAVPELVDDIGRLWLANTAGWEDAAVELAAGIDDAAVAGDLQAQLRRADRRRDAAELAAVRTRAELLHRTEFVALQAAEIDELRAEVAKAADVLAEVTTELTDVRMEIRHARDREAAAVAKARAAAEQLADLRRQLDVKAPSVDDAVAERRRAAADAAQLGAAAATARLLADQLAALLSAAGGASVGAAGGASVDAAGGAVAENLVRDGRVGRPAQRVPLALPGGVIASSGAAAEHLARSDAQFLIDGYNVAKLGWPNRPLEQQRDALLDAVENLSRRFGTDATIVFDGASIVGAFTSRRRLVRVVFSPVGVTADDVIRDEVRRLPTNRAVVVVTNDAEIIRDVRADGANVVASNALLAIV